MAWLLPVSLLLSLFYFLLPFFPFSLLFFRTYPIRRTDRVASFPSPFFISRKQSSRMTIHVEFQTQKGTPSCIRCSGIRWKTHRDPSRRHVSIRFVLKATTRIRFACDLEKARSGKDPARYINTISYSCAATNDRRLLNNKCNNSLCLVKVHIRNLSAIVNRLQHRRP